MPETMLKRLLTNAPYLSISFLGGVLMGLTPAPFNAWFLAWIALIPVWLILRIKLDGGWAVGSAGQRAGFQASSFILYPLLWGIGYHGLALSWILDLHPLTWMGVPWLGSIAIALFAWFFITFWGAALVVIWAYGTLIFSRWSIATSKRSSTKPSSANSARSTYPVWLCILFGTAFWCVLETIWGWGALYWTSISYTQSPHNLAILHLGQLSGPMAVTAAIVAVNGYLAETLYQWLLRSSRSDAPRSAPRSLVIALSLLVSLHLIGFGLYSRSLNSSPETALKVGIVQGNIPTRIKLFEEGVQRSIVAYTRGYQTLANQGVDAVVTPEGAFPWWWIGTAEQAQHPFYQAVLERGIPAWVGTVGVRENRITQSIFTISGAGQAIGRYDKVKLVPLGEYIPFETIVGRLINRLSPVEASMIPGRFNQQFKTPFGLAIAGICYESAFPTLFRNQAAAGGEFIITASNNDPYGRGMMAQHHAQDTMRAIETDRWTIRATNTGLSGIVTPHGQTVWLSGFRTYETHADTIYRRQTKTLYVRWGDWLTPLLLGLALGGWGIQRLWR